MSLIMSLILAIQGAAAQGVLWGVMALGVYITFRILNFSDMTVDGSFALGGCVSAILIVNGVDPFVSLLIALLAGILAGLITGVLHTVLKIPAILSGILTMIALYSINIRITGKSNVPLLKSETIIDKVYAIIPLSDTWINIIIGVVFGIIIIGLMYWFFGTEIGCAIRATGNNEDMVRALGENTDKTKTLALMIGNALAALSGGLVSQSLGFADVGMGTGTIVIGLASIVIGEVIFGRRFSFAYRLSSVIVGSILYRIIVALVLQLGLKPSDLKLITAVIVAIALSIPVLSKKQKK
jgi:putative tryptophan/tyrosine transport system permease protein